MRQEGQQDQNQVPLSSLLWSTPSPRIRAGVRGGGGAGLSGSIEKHTSLREETDDEEVGIGSLMMEAESPMLCHLQAETRGAGGATQPESKGQKQIMLIAQASGQEGAGSSSTSCSNAGPQRIG